MEEAERGLKCAPPDLLPQRAQSEAYLSSRRVTVEHLGSTTRSSLMPRGAALSDDVRLGRAPRFRTVLV